MMTETPTPRTQQHWAEAVAECITDEQEALRLIGIYEDDEWQRVMLDIGRTLLVIRRELTAEREARERAEKERAAIGDQYRAFAALDRGDVWYWQGDGSDHPESLASGCRVVMTGAQVRELTAERAARERAEAERDAMCAENDTLRGLLGNSGKPCAHCGLPVERWGECVHGFPGCARADDAQLSDLFAVRAALAEAEAERVKAEAERDALIARVRDDSLAMTCQSIGQYRTVLLAKEGA